MKAARDYTNAVPSGAAYTPLVYPHPLQAQESGGIVTNLLLTSSVNPTTFGNSTTFTATWQTNGVTDGSQTPTTEFDDNGGFLATASMTAGVSTYSTSALSVGTHPITAKINSLVSSPVSQVVNSAAQPNKGPYPPIRKP